MDPSRFDRLTRMLAGVTNRRTALAGLLGGVLVPLLPGDATDAKNRQRKHLSPPEKNRDRGHGPEQDVGKNDGNGGGNQGPVVAKKKKTCKPPLKACKAGKKTKCVNLATSAANCGKCGKKCPAGQTCLNKKCCAASQRCGSKCCPAGQTCQNGVCGAAPVLCGGQVCGATETCIGNACCANDQACSGVCCSGNQDCCGVACTTVATDPANCGACGQPCDSQTADQCVGGSCQCGNGAKCGSGDTCCNGTCKTLSTDPTACGTCGNTCPGNGQATANVTCQNSTCTFTCKGQNYDVNNNPADGCEQPDTASNRTQATAASLGSRTCNDSDAGSFSGAIYSDTRAHANPAAAGIDPAVGAAPLWFKVVGSGGFFCENDPRVAIAQTGGSSSCYKLTVITDKKTQSATVVNGSAVITMSSSSYTDGSTIYFKVEKTCAGGGEAANFTANFHL